MSNQLPPEVDRRLADLFARNRAWAAAVTRRESDFFERLARQQTPRYFWIGCSDSRVPANEIVGLLPGEMFVHRNVANVVVHTDLNCLSVLQYAVDVLEVDHVMVVGHYGCGGVRAAWEARPLGLIDNWLRHVQDVAARHADELQLLGDAPALYDRLCELNVIEQAVHVCRTTIVQDAWRRGRNLAVHAWVYSLQDGLLRDLGFAPASADEVGPQYAQALRHVPARLAD
ncbi:MAG TPA: carbonate dehydratase [Gemmatimonadales bacterium]|nr:carbonate dehydratase [Gemmatimonadales bacterium]